jgi:hypothetical protein
MTDQSEARAVQPDLWGNDRDPEFELALRSGWIAELLIVAGRRVLAGEDGALQLLADVLGGDPPHDYDPTQYIQANQWTYARTMPENPHEYLLIHRSSDWREHLRFVRFIRLHGFQERLGREMYRYSTPGDGWRYWCSNAYEAILNRRAER